MNEITKSILKDPTNYPIPESKEDKLKILHDLASQVLEGEPKFPDDIFDLPGKGVDPAMSYILRFEAPFVIFACKIMYLRLGRRFSRNRQWGKFFHKQSEELSPTSTKKVPRKVWDDNNDIAKQFEQDFEKGIK